MGPQQDLAIVLRSVAFEERHRVVTAITEHHGRVSAMARNAIQSRRFGGALEPFTASLWLFHEKPGSDLLRLDEAQARRSFEKLRADFDRLSMAAVLNELMLRLAPERVSCPELFRLHANALATLDEAEGTGAPISLLNTYLAKLLQWAGIQPRLTECLACGASLSSIAHDASLSCLVAEAGWECPSCRPFAPLRATPLALHDALVGMSVSIRQTSDRFLAPESDHRDLFRFLEALLVYHTPGLDQAPLKGLRFLGLESNVPLPPASPH